MALLDKMKDSISIAGQEVSQKAKTATESVKINNQIKTNERMIEKLTYQVGLQCVNKYLNDPSSEYAELFSEILRLQEENQKYRMDLQMLTAAAVCPQCGFSNNTAAKFCISCGAPLSAAPQTQPSGGRKCGKCGFMNDTDAAFCVECGTSLAQEPEAPLPAEEEVPAAQAVLPANLCKNCGATLDDGSLFCTQCGARRD